MFESDRRTKLVKKWLRMRPKEIQYVSCDINNGIYNDRAVCYYNVNDIIKVKRRKRPSNFEGYGRYPSNGVVQNLVLKVTCSPQLCRSTSS